MADRDPWADVLEDAFRESRRLGMSIGDAFDVIAQAVRTKLVESVEQDNLSKADHVMVQSIVGAASMTPAVQCRVGIEQWQWDVDQAREHAQNVLTCTEAAVHDAALMRYLILGPMGLESKVAMAAVVDLRRFRGDVEREDWRPTDD